MKIPVGLSNHHVHITRENAELLFGSGQELTLKRQLKQLGEFACEEVVDIYYNDKKIEHVRLIGPYREYTQIELLSKDCVFLGINEFRSNSGDLDNAPLLKIKGPKGTCVAHAFVANNHLHASEAEAKILGITSGDIISVKTSNNQIINNIFVKSDQSCSLELHMNKDEGELLGLENESQVELVEEK